MTKWILRLWVKDVDRMQDQDVRERCGVVSGMVGIVLNLCLFAAKLLAGLLTGSIAIMADAFNNLSDAGSSIITLVGFKMAGRPADPEHPFGHGRIEYVAGFVVSMIVILMGAELLKSSVEKIFAPETVAFSWISLGILVASILVKGWMCLFNRKLGKLIDSTAMQATARDSLSDAVATTTVVIGIGITQWTGWSVDGYTGLIVALFILYTGVKTAKETLSPLLGEKPSPELVEQIKHTVLSHEDIIGIHDLIIHNYGPGRSMISLHAEVPAGTDVIKMHDTIDMIEYQLRDQFHCDAVIHMDPIDLDDARTNAMYRQLATMVKSIDPSLSIHDFRMTQGHSHTNLIFDLVVPYRFRMTDQQLKDEVYERVHQWEGTYYVVINIDRLYV